MILLLPIILAMFCLLGVGVGAAVGLIGERWRQAGPVVSGLAGGALSSALCGGLMLALNVVSLEAAVVLAALVLDVGFGGTLGGAGTSLAIRAWRRREAERLTEDFSGSSEAHPR